MTKEDLPKPILIEDLGMMFATDDSKQKTRLGVYKCGFCGKEFKTVITNVKRKRTKSCCCYRKRRIGESTKKHGLSHTRLYTVWNDMNVRVHNPQYKQYNDYGGRGITICEEWKNDFMSFYNWAISNGYLDDLSIDRINNDGNYEPNNCRWVTQTIQNRNQRIQTNNTSGYKGVHFNKGSSKHMARIHINKKRIYLGLYPTAEEGAIAYNNYIIENNLEGFILNEIPEEYQQCNLN